MSVDMQNWYNRSRACAIFELLPEMTGMKPTHMGPLSAWRSCNPTRATQYVPLTLWR